ncbi:potassium transporter 21-like [Phragmites australis]|uniref:potassium transporter 21-like n=1 Tax=Phragmites australis TaxID=29695 RepID=UPI002D7A26F4|nr:potassium transporter 21-like [Phragmites australis]
MAQLQAAEAAAMVMGMATERKASSCCSEDTTDLELALEVPSTVQRQDSLYRDATRAAGANHHGQDSWARTLRLAFQCVGVLYGDIGTSPLYVYSSTFTAGIRHTDDLLGVLSLIIYSFLLFTIIKYVYIALRANDDGDGGTFALYSLISRHAKVSLVPNHQAEDELQLQGENNNNDDDIDAVLAAKASLRGSSRRRTVQLASPRERRAQWVKDLLETSKPVRISLFLLTILATAMVISDACLTPAISVLSAVGGLKEKAPNLTTDQIVWITVAILVVLFAVQRFGTDKVGYLFAPVILLWLLLIGAVGVYNLVKHDVGVLRAFNPKYIIDYFCRNKKDGWVSLGGVLLCFTGTEALFADLGYFSIRSIQLSFGFGLVPAVLLAYIGQAAFLRRYPEKVANTFYQSTPDTLFWPTFVLALAASVIGSQAMISCAFATISHSQALGCFPRVKILHTSRQYQGQLYIPEVNFLLAVVACVVTLSAKTTALIAEAHGICVVLVMLITTLLLTLVMLLVWRVNAAWVALFFAVFVASESVYLSSVLYRFAHGGYIPVAMSAVLMAVMVLWHYVHVKRYKYELERTVSHDSVRELLARRDLLRVPGVGLFYTELVQGIPPVFPHLVEKIPSIHAVLLFVSVKHLPVPHVDATERFLFRQVATDESSRVFRCVARYGYRDPLEEAKDFAASLVERLQYYIRDVNLYGVNHQQAAGKVSYPSSRCDSMAMARARSITGRCSIGISSMRHSASYTESLALARARSSGRAMAMAMAMPMGNMNNMHSASCTERELQLARARSTGIFAEEMLTPAESFSELARTGSSNIQHAAVKISLEEIARIEEEQRFIEREMEKGVVYILGESEVVARPHSSLLKKVLVNYAYAFLRKNCRQGEKMLAIPKSQLLKVGMSYEI